ncbi:uncharacterized protein KY384_005791 [Bacidia gigantensis]|uniref:uncharacterized protein n=1 Tax=Bacidia gigantensis TaxID=2732470 RepID=UPI001D055821|nr:uncharacterized protein KY384_005791 [Bacidia gigantensis]KAG8529156.1 hypothetical protein KY384_005791 [Bacidia gigantensis]
MSSHKLHPFSTPTGLAHSKVNSRSQSRRSLTPNGRVLASSARLMNSIEGDLGADDDPRLAIFKELYAKSESRLASLFEKEEVEDADIEESGAEHEPKEDNAMDAAPTQPSPTLKRKARAIDEDDYDDESEGEEASDSANVSPLKSKSALPPAKRVLTSHPMLRQISQSSAPGMGEGTQAGKTTEEARRKLDEEAKATEDAARRTFHTIFYTLENDKDAMLEQKKLEELERKVDAELGDGSGHHAGSGNAQQGILSQTNLGASSLTLKNLIKRIDDERDKVKASDSELRTLMSEVRKNRSKWASEEKIGQEELYESLDKVLSELKGHTEHSTYFLNKVNKKEAPDYSVIIKHPMDFGTMTKKLRALQYKSKQDFVDDLMLIWANCLKYNATPDHYMRKHATFMRKQTEKLVPLIPDITIRDRAEVEAEERRLQHSAAELDGDEESDDEPIISSRGRPAPSKKSKKGTVARKAPASTKESSHGPDSKPPTSLPNGLYAPRDDTVKPDSEVGAEGSHSPPHGTATPTGVGALLAHAATGSQSELADADTESMVNGIVPSMNEPPEEPEYEDLEYKIWKSVTKKDRALVTAERHRLFLGDRLDPEAPALLRTKAGMRGWLRKQKQAVTDSPMNKPRVDAEMDEREIAQPKGETLAEGMEGEDEKVLPDYYDPLAAIPDISARLRWVEDSEGDVQDNAEECLREIPKGIFLTPQSALTKKIDGNMHQVQKTRKITGKIGVVKQMALQSQLYQGQFQKTDIVPLAEQDVNPHVTSCEGPVLAPDTSRAALRRSAAKLLMHAGFEEFQPSAMEAFTDMASDYFKKIASTLTQYSQAPLVPIPVQGQENKVIWKPRFSRQDCILHTLQENGADLESLDTYVNEEIDRTGTRINATHDRIKAHLADLLRPALHDAGPDGSGAFNDDSEQFVSGDFAEELGDDFFGFKELGLDVEFGDASMSVPLHLLQKSMFNANRAQNSHTGASNLPLVLTEPEPYEPVTIENVANQVGLVQQFFRDKLTSNGDKPLVEDDNLPIKQRMPKPKLPPTGKITSPRKRPFKEPGPGKGHPRKKMKLNDGDTAKIGEGEAAVSTERPGDPVKTPMNGEAPKVNGIVGGENMSREPSRNGVVSGTTQPTKPLTNGIMAHSKPDESGGDEREFVTPTKKGKEKEVNGDSLPSPASLEAT